MAISKERKREIVAQYGEWLARSQAFVLTEYIGLTVKDMDELRAKVREAGGEFHIVKNTLAKRALDAASLETAAEHFVGTTAIGFAYEDPPALAKAITDFAKGSDFLKIKAGYMDNRLMSAAEVKMLANVPPLPVMRAILLSTILAPATQLVRTLSEPGRQIAAVLKAFSEKDAVPGAA
ncbi:MAG: 50S ribosomal protein L10 [Chloroflexi bacterium]|nr:50S ribosomal protein L10 [Chloroflexota bacterium]